MKNFTIIARIIKVHLMTETYNIIKIIKIIKYIIRFHFLIKMEVYTKQKYAKDKDQIIYIFTYAKMDVLKYRS